MNHGDRFHARGMGPRWPGAAGRRCRVREVMWTAWDESAQSRVLRDVTVFPPKGPQPEVLSRLRQLSQSGGRRKFAEFESGAA